MTSSGTRASDVSGVRRILQGCLLALLLTCATAPGALAHEAPARICSVSLAADELLAMLVPTERVVCVTRFADDAASSNVAGHYPEDTLRVTARIEPVLGQKPDLVVASPWNSAEFLSLLDKSGIESIVLGEMSSFAEIRTELLRLGGILGEGERAAEIARDMDARLARLAKRFGASQKRPRVLSFSHLIVAGEGTSVDALIEAAGGVNAADELGVEGHQKVSMEAILGLNPDLLLLGFEPGATLRDVLDAYPHLTSLRSVRERRVVLLAPRELTTVTPHLLDTAERLAEEFHPKPAPSSGPAEREAP